MRQATVPEKTVLWTVSWTYNVMQSVFDKNVPALARAEIRTGSSFPSTWRCHPQHYPLLSPSQVIHHHNTRRYHCHHSVPAIALASFQEPAHRTAAVLVLSAEGDTHLCLLRLRVDPRCLQKDECIISARSDNGDIAPRVLLSCRSSDELPYCYRFIAGDIEHMASQSAEGVAVRHFCQ